MKKIFFIIMLILRVVVVVFSQHSLEDFFLRDGEKTFYLQMPVSEVYKILGTPNEIITHPRYAPNHFDRIVLRYNEIEFHYYVFFDDPKILLIAFGGQYQIGNMNLIGSSREEILKKYGDPNYIERQGEYIHYRYVFKLSWDDTITMQIRFNALGICDGIILVHGLFYI